MYISSLLALKAFLNSVVADDLHVVTIDGSAITISRSNNAEVLGTYELKEPAVPEADEASKKAPEPKKDEKK